MTNDEWLTASRHLCISNNSNRRAYTQKEIMLRQLFSIASKASTPSCAPVIIESHEAIIQLLPHQNKVICDTHFVDYATLIAAAFYDNSLNDIKKIANAMLADSMIKSDDIVYALYFAREYMDSLPVSMISTASDSFLTKKVLVSRSLQSFFAIRHELIINLEIQHGLVFLNTYNTRCQKK